jgi:AP-2 complex subunit sigma-1
VVYARLGCLAARPRAFADVPYDDEEKMKIRGEVHRLVAPRDTKYQSNFVEVSPRQPSTGWPKVTRTQFRNYKIIYRRYAGLFFGVCVDANDNEFAYLEAIHLFVEVLGEWRTAHLPSALTPKLRRFLWQCASLSGAEASPTSASRFANSILSSISTKQVCLSSRTSSSCWQVYAILDEVFLAGEIQETSKSAILDRLEVLEGLS